MANPKSSEIDQAIGCEQVKGGRKLNVTLVTNDDGWKITVTTQLLTELAKNYPSVKVSGVVAERTPELEDWAKKLKIELVNPKRWIGYSEKDCLAFPPDSLDIDILIIHSYGCDLGRQAQIIKDAKKCKWLHVVHTNSEELAKYMKKEAGSQAGHQESEHDVQLQLCEIADIIIAIGPKVAEAYRTYLRFRGKDVFGLTPVIFHDLIDIRPVIEHGDIFRLAVSATYFKKYFEVKGVDIAAQSIALLDDFSYRIIFIVLPGEDTKVLESLLVNEKYINPRQFTVRPVKKNTEDLKKLLFEVHLFILPSRTEGFGTTCLSALSADVPVLVSGNTGLGMALRKLPSGDNFVIDSEQPEDWAKKVKEVRAKGAINCAFEARRLRKEYMEKFHWREQCDELVKKMFEMFPENQESKKKSVEHLDLEGTDTVEGFYLEGAIQEMKVSTVPVQDNENGTLAKLVPKTAVPENNAHTLGPAMIVAGFSGRRVQETLDTTLHGTDVVDGLRGHQEPSSRLLTYVKQIPFQIRAKICIMLNILDDLEFRDFRLLGEKMNFDIYIIRNLEQRRNPTDELLQLWCSTRSTQPTVGCLIELLKDSDLERWDVVDILEKWVEDGDKK
ncbi:uncharacterized protein [Montipora capricornis]|uniref:uncharacterized protein n=1 Tax=Montipora capricornis TaxID=246305 RepID=UPI0035F156B6